MERSFEREEGRSLPIAPGIEVRGLSGLGRPERLPLPLRPLSESLSEAGNAISPASETGDMLPEPALRRVRVAKFLLPSNLVVGLAINSSNEGGPRGCRIGCSPARACPGPKAGVDGKPIVFGNIADLGPSKEVGISVPIAIEFALRCPRRNAPADGGGNGAWS